MEPIKLQNIVQAILQSSTKPMSLNKLLDVFRGERSVQTADIQEALEALLSKKDPIQELKPIAGGYRYLLKLEYAPWIQKARLSDHEAEKLPGVLTEVLAIIAYKQPISRGEIEWVRGRQTSTVVFQQLEERGWVRIVGYGGEHNRAALYGTTKTFLTYFGLNSVRDLPDLPEVLELKESFEKETETSTEEEGV